MDRTTKTDDIDLLQLFLRGVRTVRENFLLILIFFLAGSALGFGYYFSAPKVYESKMVISSDILTESYAKKVVDNLNRHLAEGDAKQVAQQFNISEEAARTLGYVRIESPYTNEGEITKEKERIFFVVTIDISSQEAIGDLQRGLVHLFENNPYVKERVKLRRDQLKEMVGTANKEIKDLEALKTKLYAGELNSKGTVMFDVVNLNKEIMEITKLKHESEEDLVFAESVHVVEGFNTFTRPVNPKLSISMVAGSFVGLIFVAILIAFKSIRKILAIEEANRRAA